MNINFATYIERGFGFVREHPQLLMTIVLAVFIPVAFLVSGQQFLNAARLNQESLELDRVGAMQDLFAAYVEVADFDPIVIQSEIRKLASQNPDITEIRVAREEGFDIRIIASLDPAQLNTLALEPESFQTSYTNPNRTMTLPTARDGVRYWRSYRLVKTVDKPDHYIFFETSLESIDREFAARIMHAYYWLIGLLLVIFYLLFRHVRLIDYAYLYRETKKAIETRDLFTNMITHELRAPLTAMRGYASMIREREGVDEATRKNALEIENAAGRLVTIVSDLLDVARIQSGKLLIENGTVHVSGTIRSVVEALHPIADEKNITLVVDDVYGNILMPGDEKRFYQALTNLVNNAIKYTKEGTITVSLMKQVDRIELRVKDTGMGISSSDQQKLFAPFARVGGTETASITGTGLGMWITKQLVELMGGSIGIESIKGIGTHVVVTFPMKKGA